ncbi:zinc-dependent metalloprotease [Pedobacter africanus]|uniref:Zinc-dependent metalloprotease n=1 Tax=Pedobacter africanus TaxID=151894 RepID=A0A1W2A1Y9_9SPHI|nr:zinc-dependent metalloprotease [Pedobacter africanus]SMC54674.1 protein of unknown function [Pedobacter africanus]
MRYISVLIICSVFLSSCWLAKYGAQSNNRQTNVKLIIPDSTKKIPDPSKKGSFPRPLNEIITSKAKTDSGLFIVHFIDGKYFFELSKAILEKDLLVVNRISKAAADIRPGNGFSGFSGDEIGSQILRFEKGPNHKLFIKSISYREQSKDSTENGMYRTLKNSSLQPIVASFDIKAYTPDSNGVVIDLTDYINGDNLGFSFSPSAKKAYTIGSIQLDKSYITKINSFPLNVEVQALKTFNKNESGTASFELNSSFILLPTDPMEPRAYDARVGYFAESYRDFDARQEVKWRPMITRWRLEPKKEDIEKYLKGELVEPKKPIVFYIDPATPKKWVPYLIQGVNDWQKAFEKAGFKNAIYALEAPKDNLEWSLYDARHSAIVYKPSTMANASGPHIHDPRTGEILESHVNWYHNVMEVLKTWYMIQAGINDKRAQKLDFDDQLMGQLIRFVSSHEIGHTLGLMHNFGASSTIPVEKLRDKAWVEANGHTPSIMDYARFNYVAQPKDSISERGIFPRIGIYDEWAIEWGYRWFPAFLSPKTEKSYMSQWVSSQLKKDKRFWFGQQPFTGGAIQDPRAQSEDLGDDAMKASYYGILNLKRTMRNLQDWTREPNGDYTQLKAMRNEVVSQYQRYIGHVSNNIGLYMWTEKTVDDQGNVVAIPNPEKTKSAVSFLNRELFETPDWIYNKDINLKVGMDGKLQPVTLQIPILTKLLSVQTYANLSVWPEYYTKTKVYSFSNLLEDLNAGIWKELFRNDPISFHRRNLQKAYAERLIYSVSVKSPGDYQIIMKEEVKDLLKRISKALLNYPDKASRLHLSNLKEKLRNALDPKISAPVVTSSAGEKAPSRESQPETCWSNKFNP